MPNVQIQFSLCVVGDIDTAVADPSRRFQDLSRTVCIWAIVVHLIYMRVESVVDLKLVGCISKHATIPEQ